VRVSIVGPGMRIGARKRFNRNWSEAMNSSPWRLPGLLAACLLIGGCVSATTDQEQGGSKVQPKLYEAPIKDVYLATRTAIESLKWKITSENQATFSIQASVPMSMRSWGEKLTVVLSLDENDRVKVDVQSKTGPQIVDYGKNKQNILALYQAIDVALE
jgi:hypothetical protein